MTQQLPEKLNEKLLGDIAELDELGNNGQLPLPAYGSWSASVHQFDKDSINVLKTALAARRPVLLRGEPGTGKSQLAHAAAVALNRLFVYEVVNSHTEGQDLLWKFDAVGRLAEAQTLQAGTSEEARKEALDTKRYISPAVLWWALCWKSASKTYNDSQYQLTSPEKPKGWEQEHGSVILIDEIDKANAELPNSLLEILGNNAIQIPWLDKTIGGKDSVPPLVIITTNEERELPPAFVRRCLVLNLNLPKDDDELITLLKQRGKLHFKQCGDVILQKAAEQLVTDRNLAKEKGVTPPGQAEYLDMLRALTVLGGNDQDKQLEMLEEIKKFVMRKYPVMHDE
ncbi:AAA family ATPase [Leucothrix mucor]|uniref:AAA family ATPase n=1 Tax=Leucothrix mucor TaxID=45248 RepID=UPI0003B426DE|nr:MoxR family ATPase [Leucothrix mucor]